MQVSTGAGAAARAAAEAEAEALKAPLINRGGERSSTEEHGRAHNLFWRTGARRGATVGLAAAGAAIGVMYGLAYGVPNGTLSLVNALFDKLLRDGAPETIARIFSHAIPDVSAVVAGPAIGAGVGAAVAQCARR